MTKEYDLEYIEQGLFVAFLPISKEGEAAWKQMALATNGTGKVLAMHMADTLAQLRAAGYSVRKAPKQKPIDADALLKELGL